MLFCKLKFWNWNLKTSFAAAGLHLPQMLFWNCIKKRNKVQEIRETLFFVHSFDCAPMHLRIRWINNGTLCTAQWIIKRLQISWELLTMQILWSNQLLTSRQKCYKQVSDQGEILQRNQNYFSFNRILVYAAFFVCFVYINEICSLRLLHPKCTN